MTIRLKSMVKGSSRGLKTNVMTGPDECVIFTMHGENANRDLVKDGILNVTKADAIRFATDLLQELAPGKLNVPKISDHPVGTFLRNSGTGEIVQVVEWTEEFDDWRKDQDGEQCSVTAARRIDGSPIVPFDDGTDPKFRWEPVEVEVETKTVWTVK